MKTMYKYLALLIIGVIPSIAFGVDNAVFTKDDEKIINQYFKEAFGDKAEDASKVFASLHNQEKGIDSQGMKAVCISGLTKEQTVKFDCEKMWANIIDKTHPDDRKAKKGGVTTDAEFAKLCKEYGHKAYQRDPKDCVSYEIARVPKLEDVESALKPSKDYWTAKGFVCEGPSIDEKEDSKYTRQGSVVVYTHYCYNNANFKVYTAGVALPTYLGIELPVEKKGSKVY